jgi:hypothetical protein
VGEHTSDVGEVKGEWDPSLYAGSAAYYVQGRVPYTQELIACPGRGANARRQRRPARCRLRARIPDAAVGRVVRARDGAGRRPHMLAEARRQAAAAGVPDVEWVHMRAEALTPESRPNSAWRPWRKRFTGWTDPWWRRLLDVLTRGSAPRARPCHYERFSDHRVGPGRAGQVNRRGRRRLHARRHPPLPLAR